MARALGETSFEAGIHATLGVNDQRQHKPTEAEAEYQQALAMFQSVGDRLSATRTLNNLAVIEKERGNLKAAEASYLGALQTVQASATGGASPSSPTTWGDLALAQEGGLDRARPSTGRPSPFAKPLGTRMVWSIR